MKTIKPYLKTFVLGKDRNWKKLVGAIIKDIAVSIFKIPVEMNRLLSKANQGEFEFRVKGIDQSIQLLYTLGHQILYGLFCMMTGGLTYFSYLQKEAYLTKLLGSVSVFFAICLLSNMWRTRQNSRKKNRKPN